MDRRRFLTTAAAAALVGFGAPRARADAPAAGAVSERLAAALDSGEYVYVSPIRSDGAKSRCHKEVWFAWLDGSVVLTTAHDAWKSRAVDRGLDRARIWVGDVGRGPSLDALAGLPRFEARVEKVKDPALVERMLAAYERKYPREIGRWRDRMREGNRDGSRVLLRYRPTPAAGAGRQG